MGAAPPHREAALLILDGIDTKRHRYVNLTVVAIMVGGVGL
jgi:hypothetical protein